jgi:hypothetical protein
MFEDLPIDGKAQINEIDAIYHHINIKMIDSSQHEAYTHIGAYAREDEHCLHCICLIGDLATVSNFATIDRL